MGKYAATRAFRNDRKRSNGFHSTANYFLEVPKDESQYWVQSFLSGADPTGIYSGYLTARDNTAYMRDYMRNTGLSWSDIKYPSRTIGFGSNGALARSSMSFVSKNIHRLYR